MNMATGRFRSPKTEAEEIALLSETVPKNTKCDSKWAVNVFTTCQDMRMNKKAPWKQLEGTDLRELLSRTCQPHSSTCSQSLNFWLCKFICEVAKQTGKW